MTGVTIVFTRLLTSTILAHSSRVRSTWAPAALVAPHSPRHALAELVMSDGLAREPGGRHEGLGLCCGGGAREQSCGGCEGSQSLRDVSHLVVSPFEKTLTQTNLFQAKERSRLIIELT